MDKDWIDNVEKQIREREYDDREQENKPEEKTFLRTLWKGVKSLGSDFTQEMLNDQLRNYYNQEKIDMTTYSLYRKALSLFPRLDLYQKQEVISAMNDLKAKIKAQEEDSEQNEDDNDFY